MSIEQIPPNWATNDNYSSGPDAGTPTKVDPASSANGFIRGVAAAAQHVNFVLNAQSGAGRRAFELAALRLREIRRDGVTPTDTTAAMAAVQRNQASYVVAVKEGEAFGITDWGLLTAQSVATTVDSPMANAASDGSRILISGSASGVEYAYSDDDGITWTTGMNIAPAVGGMIWNDAVSLFVVAGPGMGGGGSRTATSINGSIQGSFGGGGSGDVCGIGCTDSGLVVAVFDTTAPPTFFSGTPGVSTMTNTGGTIANSGDADDAGWLCGNNDTVVYHVARLNTGASLQVSSSADGAAWTVLASILPPAAATFDAQPKMFQCANTGLLVIVAPMSGDMCALYASLDGEDWVGPQLVADPGVEAFAVAGGRLLATFGAQLFASDGIGY